MLHSIELWLRNEKASTRTRCRCVAEEDDTTEVRFNFVNAFTLLAESVASAILLLEAGALAPSMVILHDAGSNPTQRKGKMCRGALFS